MIWIKRWVKDFFFLSHAQVNGFVILVPLLTLILFSAPAWKWIQSQRPKDFTRDRAKLDSLIALWSPPETATAGQPSVRRPAEVRLSLFNPNNADTAHLTAVGFSKVQAGRIIRYRGKGGRFRIKSDLLKIYGMDSSLYQQLYDFIDLPATVQPDKKEFAAKSPSLRRPITKFDLNLADTSQLKKINGIGDKLSVRIIRYRDVLGGFVAMNQVYEIYGLDTAVVHRLANYSFIDAGFQPRKLNINTAGERELAAHPYLRKTIARSIAAYRFQHGEFESLDDLRKIHSIESETIKKIVPYLTIGD